MSGNVQPSLDKAEHIGTLATDDNIEAKRVANYQWDGSAWQRMGLQLTPIKDFDYLSITNSATDQDTLVFKLGGSGGTTVRTLVINFASGAEKVSDSLASLSYS